MAKKLPAKLAKGIADAQVGDIVPRLRPAAWLDALRKQVPQDHLPVCEEFCGDVLVTYALDLPEQFVMLSRPQLTRLGVAEQALRTTALANMGARLVRVAVRDLDLFFAVEVENNLEACCILLDDFWEQVEIQLVEGEIVATIPCRNGLLFCPADAADGLAAMKTFVATTFEAHEAGDPNYLITDRFFRRRQKAWETMS